jgi:hypothetical protein
MGMIHNKGKDDEEVLQLPKSTSEQKSLAAIGLMKCAATGCGLYFHPMCALLYSKLSNEYCNYLRKAGPRGHYKSAACENYTLDFISVSRNEGATIYGRNGEHRKETYILPVVFCGLHDHLRDRDMYGLPSSYSEEFQIISKLMNIPYQLD